MQRKTVASALGLAMLGGGAATVLAQEPAPTVTVAVYGSKATSIEGAEALKSGQTRITIRNDAKKQERFVGLFEAKPGLTAEDVEKAITTDGPPSAIEEFGRIMVTGATVPGTPLTTTLELRDRDYYLVDLTERPALRGSFRPGAEPSTAVAPKPDARVSLRDFRITGNTTLPAEGVLQVVNRGEQVHEMIAFPLPKGTSTKEAMRAGRYGKDDDLPIGGPPAGFLGPVSPGTTNALEVKAKPGRYLLLCFMPDERSKRGTEHRRLGMRQVVTVK